MATFCDGSGVLSMTNDLRVDGSKEASSGRFNNSIDMYSIPISQSFMSIVEKTKHWLASIPLSTRFYFLLCMLVFALTSTGRIYLNTLCSSPTNILDLNFSKLASAFTHSGILHILFNMSSFIQLKSLESTNVLVSLMSFAIAFLISYPPLNYMNSLYTCSVGLSGVIFALLEIQCYGSIHSTNLFAQIQIPLKLYPWAALLLAQFLMPNVSFIGHLSGIIIGFLYAIGLLDALIPSNATLIKIELSDAMSQITSISGYITNLNYGSTSSLYNTSSSNSTSASSWYNRFVSNISSGRNATGSSNGSGNNNNNNNNFAGPGRMLGQSTTTTTTSNTPKTLPYSPSIDMSVERQTNNNQQHMFNMINPTMSLSSTSSSSSSSSSPTIAILPTNNDNNKSNIDK
ncbi:methionyl-tRNA synthetase beta subunit [Heterostelium album PN500]|uniref:Methionyl-tRNA synthetase beta subunit n=1 Tax=Heterostelium pallidum (strain ATCC 26659 / Pp 5 / PN500) TaxID=670386 RepID=D3BIQ8_HETP5|nr:methionyl-tRNA synthetase beta subunit [Heterostelium album PN500]EFA78682.1 methionyl-tRNA synthetase beta subunit [Heterostelium album PN500]|eukprot:XP_020430806.1 methionyl-tRNA synthetase beta subunit [Heterostelium album PN500]